MTPLCPAAGRLCVAAAHYGIAALCKDIGMAPERIRAIRARGWSLDEITGREMVRLADALGVDLRDLADAARGLT